VLFQPGIDKVRQFSSFHQAGVSAPSYATNVAAAKQLDAKQVVIRALVDSSEGRGITIVNRDELVQQAPLYTAYIPKKKEFRVHVFNSKVIDVQEKRKRRIEGEQREFQVRNTANGYVFCRDNVNPPVDCADVALSAVRALGRTYGAVDIIWNEKQNKSFVLEVNSRPGMQGTTVKKYAAAIRKSFGV
jgi:D-alanine-D-alanine ligase-like ATP-grasp enzyme